MSRTFTYFILLGLIIALEVITGFFLAQGLVHDWSVPFTTQQNEFSVFRSTLTGLCWVFSGSYFGIYLFKRVDRFLIIAQRVFKHTIFFFWLFELVVFFSFSRSPSIEDVLFLLSFLFVQLTLRFPLFLLIRKLRKTNSVFRDKVLVLGEKAYVRDMLSFIRNNPHVGFYSGNGANKIDESTRHKLIQKEIKAVFVHENSSAKKEHREIIEVAALNQLPVYIFSTYDQVIKSDKVVYYGFIPVYKTKYSPLMQRTNRYLKRMFDIFFSLMVIVFILSWLYPTLAFLIRRESKGPALFVQDRNGLGNELFRCFKFRSMTVNNDQMQAQKDDQRITNIGRFMRKTSIDELPQFLNVLRGDMSVVGPRPHMETHNINYAKYVDSFQLRHTVKPGITGMAQMRGFRGEIKENLDIINRIKYDIFYIRHWSFALDIKIIIRTVLNMIKGEEKAY